MLSKAGLCGVLIFGLAFDLVVCRGVFPGYSGIYGFDLNAYPNSPSAYGSFGQELGYNPAEEQLKAQQKRAYMRLGKRALMRLGKRSDQVEPDEDSKQDVEKRARLRLG